MSDLESLRETYQSERPLYQALAKYVASTVEAAVRRSGISCRTEYRAKDVASLVKKFIRKGYGSLDDVPDRAGARVIITFADSVPEVEATITRVLDVRRREDKSQQLTPDRLGYLGIHYGVAASRGDAESRAQFGERICELQLHTTAQRAWADASHELLYKPDVSPSENLARRLYRLMALMEVFDDSVVRARQTMRMMPDWREAAVLGGLERMFLSMTAREYDRELSLLVLSALTPIYDDQDAEGIEQGIRMFVDEHREKIDRIFREYADDIRHPLLFQPETLLVFERLEADSFTLKDRWQSILPLALLEGIAGVWGTPL